MHIQLKLYIKVVSYTERPLKFEGVIARAVAPSAARAGYVSRFLHPLNMRPRSPTAYHYR